MGIIRHGALGGFSGKAGSIIGSSWKNISYIKGLHKRSNKPATVKQLDQRARFSAVLAFLGPIKDVLNIGWKGQTGNRASGFNMGIQHALSYAITGTYPNYAVDKAKIQVSKGTLQVYQGNSMESTIAAKLDLFWSPQSNGLNAFDTDVLMVVLYNEEQNLFMLFGDVGKRIDGQATLNIPFDYAGQTVHAYLFYINEAGTRQSNSSYVGPVSLPQPS